ncbi:MAG: exodeoxyribonuclease VII small subunit [bacterium]|nr:exodeoxyribonuclease VII small subunit [bacterium]
MAKKKKVNFEEGLERLQEIVDDLEQGTATLDETLQLYEEGVGLAAALNAELADAETRVEELSAGLGDNRPPGDDSFEEEKPVPDEEPDSDEEDGLF